ncbi:MAG: NACHT domain-containing protein, partial [Planctomycetota bacterium]
MAKNSRKITSWRVFVSSPGDVTAEREIVEAVVQDINATRPAGCKHQLECWGWERNMASQIGPVPQQVVNQQLPDYEIYIGILSGHFGTATNTAGSGTEEEFQDALKSWKATGSPWIAFFFDNEPRAPKGKKATEQYLKVQAFRESIEEQKLGLYGTYSRTSNGNDSFRATIGRHLQIIFNKLQAEEEIGPGPSPPDPPPAPPEPESPAVRFYQKKLAENHQFLAMRGMNTDFGVQLPIEQVYVPLTTTHGRTDERRESERSRGMKGFDHDSQPHDRDIALNDVFQESEAGQYRGVILLGEPGAGKTTGARQLAWRLASGRNRPEDLGLPAGMRPVFLRLRHLDPAVIDTQGSDSDQDFAIKSLRNFLNQETYCPGGLPEEQNPGPDLWNDSNRGHGLLWILDGLDEVVDARLRAIVAGWIRDLLPERPHDRLFVTSRFQGYKNKRDVELGEHFLEMHVKPLSKLQIERFVSQWFEAAHRRIAGHTTPAAAN